MANVGDGMGKMGSRDREGVVQGWGRLKARTRKSGGSSEKGGKQG